MKYLTVIAVLMCLTACTTTPKHLNDGSDYANYQGGLLENDPNSP